MKITQEHYEKLEKAFNGAINKVPALSEYEKAGMSAKRWRWDIMWAAKISPWISQNIYQYANDDHIDTALRRISGTK